MIKFNEIKPGIYVYAQFEGELWEGIVNELNSEDKEICVQTEVQDFWFKPEDLSPIPLNEAQLVKFKFEKETNGNGNIKYKKGPFRIQLLSDGDFGNLEIWYREDRRQIKRPINVHELQNYYYDMTKVELSRN
jgi:hypothetical protein